MNPAIESDVGLSKDELERYARHVSLRGFGPAAQEKLMRGRVLIVGAGGLGSPCAMYLAASGIGCLGISDSDSVSLSNLHRQLAHTEARVGTPKTTSLLLTARALNSFPQLHPHPALTPQNALELCSAYDVVADCSDNPFTRYLVNDACVLAGVPLVSGAAVATDGQLSVYNFAGGPCYRCIHPECPAPQHCSRCADAGVLGPVPGVIGTMQALECIKVLSGVGQPLSQALLLYDALTARFTRVRLRPRRADCAACSPSSELRTVPGGPAGYDYGRFTGGHAMLEGGAAPADTGGGQTGPGRVTAAELQRMMNGVRGSSVGEQGVVGGGAGTGQGDAGGGGEGGGNEEGLHGHVVLVDVRPKELFDAARLPGSVHVSMNKVGERAAEIADMQRQSSKAAEAAPVVVVCRRGNDSRRAADMLRQKGLENVVDLVGGLHEWGATIDADMPQL